jgi:hypothetical protein
LLQATPWFRPCAAVHAGWAEGGQLSTLWFGLSRRQVAGGLRAHQFLTCRSSQGPTPPRYHGSSAAPTWPLCSWCLGGILVVRPRRKSGGRARSSPATSMVSNIGKVSPTFQFFINSNQLSCTGLFTANMLIVRASFYYGGGRGHVICEVDVTYRGVLAPGTI